MKEEKNAKLKSLGRFWSPSLTQREKYILMIKPVLGLNQSMIKSERYSYLTKHYDPLSIGLKIIEIIIENTSVINIVDVSGITRDEIFDRIKPYFKKIDKIKKKQVQEEDQEYFVNTIIDSLISPGRDTHQMEYIDYSSSNNFNWQVQPFRLLELDTTPDDEVNVTVSLELINIFTNILDMKIEDTHNAVLFMLEQQLKRGDIQSAAKSSEHNLSLTLIYVKTVQEIIFKTKRKYQTIDWLLEYPKKLTKAKEHIKICLDKESRIHDELVRKSYQIEDITDSIFYIKTLELNIQKSIDMLLPLQNLIDEARNIFEIKSSQIFDLVRTTAFQLDGDFLPQILQLPTSKVQAFFESTSEYFTSPNPPRLLTFENCIELLFKYSDLRQDPDQLRNKRKKPLRLKIKKEQLKKELFPLELRKRVISELEVYLKKAEINGIMLSKILIDFKERGFSMDDLNYLRLIIQGRFASDKFEGRYLKKEFEVKLDKSNFSFDCFHGADFIISIKKKIKKMV